jgi:hypothetical protein
MTACVLWPSYSQISLSTAILALGKARSCREPNLGCSGADRPGWWEARPPPPKKKKSLHEGCWILSRIAVMKLICSLVHFECDGHTVHMFSQRRLTADWLAPRETVHGCAVRSLLTGCQVTSRPRDRFSRYSKLTDTFRTAYIWYGLENRGFACRKNKVQIQTHIT